MQRIDLTGKHFGQLFVVERAVSTRHGKATWLCRCNCGGESIVIGSDLQNGHTRSCGCLLRDDIAGQRFGRLTAIEYFGSTPRKQAMWLCRCDCGTETHATVGDLRRRNTRSCGCFQADVGRAVLQRNADRRRGLIWPDYRERVLNHLPILKTARGADA